MVTIITARHCLICNNTYELRADGTIQAHGYARTGPAKQECRGSRCQSLEAEARELSEILATAPQVRIAAVLAELRDMYGTEVTDRLYAAADALID